MTGCTVLAFLFCDRASISDGKTRLDGIFDAILFSQPVRPFVPRIGLRREPTEFFVYYKVAVDRPCTLSLKVFDPHNGEIAGEWNDRVEDRLSQSVWSLPVALFEMPGTYTLELWHNSSQRLVTATLGVTIRVLARN
jgi:hypothetical protein